MASGEGRCVRQPRSIHNTLHCHVVQYSITNTSADAQKSLRRSWSRRIGLVTSNRSNFQWNHPNRTGHSLFARDGIAVLTRTEWQTVCVEFQRSAVQETKWKSNWRLRNLFQSKQISIDRKSCRGLLSAKRSCKYLSSNLIWSEFC